MANTPEKKIKLFLSSDLYKLAKEKANQTDKTLEEWICSLIEAETQGMSAERALDWGRIDSRIDQRTAVIEHQLETLESRIAHLVKEQKVTL